MGVAEIEPNGQPRRGRPRQAAADRAIFDAAQAVIVERGYRGLTVEEVASRAGVARTTVYRRWPTRDHLAVAVATSLVRRHQAANTGDVRQDLLELILDIATTLMQPGSRELVAELVAATSRNPDLASAFSALFAERRAAAFQAVDRGIARGQLRADVDRAVLIDQLAGALYYRLLITGDPLDAAYVRRLVEAGLQGAAA
jgi:AcrR family transcriptional regulator